MKSNRKKLIIGGAFGYVYSELEPFVSTLKKSGYNGEIVLLYQNINERSLGKLRKDGIRLVPFESTFPYMSSDLARYNIWSKTPGAAGLNMWCIRFLLFYSFLRAHENEYEHVLLTDIRDVIFQRDPFNLVKDDLAVFLEREGVIISKEPTNRRWIEEIFGVSGLDLIGNKPIICGGTIMGSPKRVGDYLEKVLDIIFKHIGTGAVMSFGAEQAPLIYVIHAGMMPDAKIYENNRGPILTLALESTVDLGPDGIIINKDGTTPAVIHQYDRHWKIAKRYYSRRLRMRLLWRKYGPQRMARIMRYRLALFVKSITRNRTQQR